MLENAGKKLLRLSSTYRSLSALVLIQQQVRYSFGYWKTTL